MRWRDEVAEVGGDVDTLNDNLILTIKSVASNLDIYVDYGYTSGINSRNKPWFDINCRKAKRDMVMAFREFQVCDRMEKRLNT